MKGSYVIPFEEQVLREVDQKYTHEWFERILEDPVIDRGLGCMFGSFIGDALGAFCEFQKNINPDLLKQTMQMNGGGTFKLRPGQFTDDSELATSLLIALTHYNKQDPFKTQYYDILSKIALEYKNWGDSKPFDIGITCRNGIQVLRGYEQHLVDNSSDKKKVISQLLTQVNNMNRQSQSNGSLMRITPLPFFFSLIELQDKPLFHQFVRNQIGLLHPNNTIVKAGQTWTFTLLALIKRKNDAQIKQIVKKLDQQAQQQLGDWIKESKLPYEQRMSATVNMGWGKIAWTYGLRYLREISQNPEKINSTIYQQTLRKVIGQGGDTDTNAAIVGGLIGSLVGFKNLPIDYVKKLIVLRFPVQKQALKRQKKRTDRPNMYEPRYALSRAFFLIRTLRPVQQSEKNQKNKEKPLNQNNSVELQKKQQDKEFDAQATKSQKAKSTIYES